MELENTTESETQCIEENIEDEPENLEIEENTYLITHVDFFPIEIEEQITENSILHKPKPIRKIPTVEKLLVDMGFSPCLPSKKSEPIPIDHTNRYL
jgi:hypothetical protein